MDEAMAWLAPDGSVTDLPVLWDAHGRFAPPVALTIDRVPGQPGGVVRQAQHGIREMALPLHIAEDSEALLRAKLRLLTRKFNQVGLGGKPLPGRLRNTAVDGVVREIAAYYTGGLELDESADSTSGPLVQKCVLTFSSPDPYWCGAQTTQTFTMGEQPKFFPIFPLRLSASQVVVENNITNDGDVDAYPVWTLTGPGAQIKIINLTTGQMIRLGDNALGAGEILTIDTRYGRKTVTKTDGTNLFSWLSNDSSLWALQPGANLMHLEMSGSTTQSAFAMAYTPRYLSP